MATQPENPDLDLQDQGAGRGGPSLVQIAWQRKSLVILGVMIGMVLGLLYYAQRQPIYQATASVLVVKRVGGLEPTGPVDVRAGIMEDYMSTQQVLIRSPEIIKGAVHKLTEGLRSFPGETGIELVYSIRDSLTVQRDVRDTSGAPNNILTISFRGPVADECPKVIEAVIDAYQSFLNEVYKNVGDRTLELILQAQNTLTEGLKEKQQKWDEFRTTIPVPLLRIQQGQASMNIFAERLRLIESDRSALLIKKAKTERRLLEITKVYKEKGPEAAMDWIQQIGVKVTIFENTGELEKQLLSLRIQREIALVGYGPGHPRVLELDKAIQLTKSLYGKMNLKPDGKDPEDKKAETDTVKIYLNAMQAEIEDSDTLLRMFDGMFETEQKSAREMNNWDVKDDQYRHDIRTSRDLLDNIVKRLQEINLVKDSGGYDARPIAPPGGMGAKVAPRAMQVFPIAGIAGLLAGLCLAYLAELSDKSFRTPAEIRRRLGLPVIGHIPFYVPDEKATKQMAAGETVVDPMICTHYASNSLSSEAFRSVRTALYFNTQGVGHQVIQVTSPNVSDGKSTLAANLAVSIAQSGKRTILIDADCRRPRAHKIFGITAESGLATVIAGQTDLASAIKPTAVANLSLLPCGPRPANPSELLTSPRFKELLDIIRAQYDFVIVDTPPLLVVTDPCVVAPRVDGVILAIRVTKNGRPFAERAKEILASLGANVLGVVVNGLGSQTGGRYGYGYDQYSYGYQYGYTYRYSYTYTDEYSDDKAASYYQNAPASGGDAPADEAASPLAIPSEEPPQGR